MLSGDLSTMSLADVLQWIDNQRTRALLRLLRPDGTSSWLLADERMIVSASAPMARGKLATDGTPAAPGAGLRALAREYLLDSFLTPEGKFDLREAAAEPSPGVPIDMPVQFLVMEGLRHLDEWPRLLATYPSDSARLAATDVEPERLGAVAAAVHQLALEAPALGEARLVLGLSRPALLRCVDELRTRGLVEVEGIPHGPDVEATMLDQAQVLLRERQYAEAAHVFRSILATNPTDARARRLLVDVERLEIEAAYERFSPTDVVSLSTLADFRAALGTEQAVLDCLTRPRSVAVLVLVSPLRELETLGALKRLASRGVLTVETAD